MTLTERKVRRGARSDEARWRDAQLAVAQVFAESIPLEGVGVKLLRALLENLDWDAGGLWMLDDSRRLLLLEFETERGVEVSRFEAISRAAAFPPGVGLPGRVWSSGEASWIVDVTLDRNFPRAAAASADGLHGAFGFPILAGGEVVGVLELFAHERRDPDERLLALMSVVGAQIGQYIRRRWVEEAMRARAAFLAEVGTLLVSSLDPHDMLTRLARRCVPHLADWCIVDAIEPDGSIRRVAATPADPELRDVAALVMERPHHRSDPDAASGVPAVLRTGRAELVSDVPPERIERIAAADPAYGEMLRAVGVTSYLCVPLTARGRTLGALTLVSAASGRRLTQHDLSFAEDVARRAALALDNARLYAERSRVARALQESLLPPEPPAVPGFEVGVRFHPAGEVGGDFYDIYETGTEDWAAVVGDVCGKGAEAAALTALARYTVRAASLEARKPSRVLATLNEAVLRQGGERYCTAAYVRIRVVRGGVLRLTAASGGHPLPLVLRANGAVETLGRTGLPLGIFPDAGLADRVTPILPGDALILYTDGLTEPRGPYGGFDDQRLRAVLAACRGMDAERIAAQVESAALEFQGGQPRDDLAVVVLRARD